MDFGITVKGSLFSASKDPRLTHPPEWDNRSLSAYNVTKIPTNNTDSTHYNL